MFLHKPNHAGNMHIYPKIAIFIIQVYNFNRMKNGIIKMKNQHNLSQKIKSFFVINPLFILITFIISIFFFVILNLNNFNNTNRYLFKYICIFCIEAFLIITIYCLKSNKLRYIFSLATFAVLSVIEFFLESFLNWTFPFSLMLIFVPAFSQLIYHLVPLKKKRQENLFYKTDSDFVENAVHFIIIIVIQLTVTFLLSLLIAVITWKNRDIALIDALNIEKYINHYLKFTKYLKKSYFTILPFSFFFTIIFIKKEYLQNLNRFFISSLIAVTFLSYMFFIGYYWQEEFNVFNPLDMTIRTENFNPYNISQIKEKMTKEEIINLIGEPLSEIEYYLNHKNKLLFTKCKIDDTWWYYFSVEFDENEKASKIISYWTWGK